MAVHGRLRSMTRGPGERRPGRAALPQSIVAPRARTPAQPRELPGMRTMRGERCARRLCGLIRRGRARPARSGLSLDRLARSCVRVAGAPPCFDPGGPPCAAVIPARAGGGNADRDAPGGGCRGSSPHRMTNGRQGTAVLASRPSPPRRTPWRVAEPVALDVQYAVFVPHHAVDPILANRLDIEADRDRHGAEVPAVPVE